jgi:hypothetical protein
LRGEPRTARRAKSLRRRRRQERTERSKVAATAAGAEARDLSGLPWRLVVAGDRRRRRREWRRRATGDGDGFDGVTVPVAAPAPSLGDGGGFVGVLDTISRRRCGAAAAAPRRSLGRRFRRGLGAEKGEIGGGVSGMVWGGAFGFLWREILQRSRAEVERMEFVGDLISGVEATVGLDFRTLDGLTSDVSPCIQVVPARHSRVLVIGLLVPHGTLKTSPYGRISTVYLYLILKSEPFLPKNFVRRSPDS